jgi:hypothetical protein
VYYSPRKQSKYAKTTSFDDTLKTCTGGHEPSIVARNSKIVCYRPRKRTKYAKTTSFDNALEMCTGGYGAVKNGSEH